MNEKVSNLKKNALSNIDYGIVFLINIVIYLSIEQFSEWESFLNYFTVSNMAIHMQSGVNLFNEEALNIGFLLFNFTHLDIIHLSMNMVFGYFLFKVIKDSNILSRVEFWFIHIVFSVLLGWVLSFSIHNISLFNQEPQVHVGYSVILFTLLGAFWYMELDVKKKIRMIFEIVLIYVAIELLTSANISHIGHIIGFLGGLIFCWLTNKPFNNVFPKDDVKEEIKEDQ